MQGRRLIDARLWCRARTVGLSDWPDCLGTLTQQVIAFSACWGTVSGGLDVVLGPNEKAIRLSDKDDCYGSAVSRDL